MFSAADVPLLEFDSDKTALIEPAMMHRKQDLPEACVMIFYADVIHKLSGEGILKKAYTLATYGITIQPVDVFNASTPIGDVAVVFPGIGAPIAAAILEELIALGCRRFVACGSGGVLKPELKGKRRHSQFRGQGRRDFLSLFTAVAHGGNEPRNSGKTEKSITETSYQL